MALTIPHRDQSAHFEMMGVRSLGEKVNDSDLLLLEHPTKSRHHAPPDLLRGSVNLSLLGGG
jgi:hypothetical protein